MSPSRLIRWALGLVLQAVVAQAELSLTKNKPEAELKNSKEVTFDPLGVAAILHNPRAHRSAARLYTQPYGYALTWPHTMMFGATLIPLKVLLAHLDSASKHIHPAAASLCLAGTTYLPTVSDTIFHEFPLDIGNDWLRNAIDFEPSSHASDDIVIVNIPWADPEASRAPATKKRNAPCLILGTISLLTGLMFAGVVIAAIILLDVWALALFLFYGMHWLAGVGISMVAPLYRSNARVAVNKTTRYAIYQRPNGGLVVLKGTQDTFELWARSRWEFRSSLLNNCLHWSWISTGALAAICSVACMVNMRGYMQLAFLGLLLCSSLTEVMASRFYRQLDDELFTGSQPCLLLDSATRVQAIVRATVEAGAVSRLEGVNWVELGLLPSLGTFQRMMSLLAEVNSFQNMVEASQEIVPPERQPWSDGSLAGAFVQFIAGENQGNQSLAKRIVRDVQVSLDVWWQREKGKGTLG